jgi:tRNA(Leu) C34 or U34 (ribose-2'-O)-methylase TrmL
MPTNWAGAPRIWYRRRSISASRPSGSNLHYCSAHGLCKAAARRLTQAGCSQHETAAITGHASLEELRAYTKAADDKPLAVAVMAAVKA